MNGLSRILVAVSVVVGISLGDRLHAQPPEPKAASAQPAPPAAVYTGAPGAGMFMGMGAYGGRDPGFYLLRMNAVLKELKLTDQQKQLLKELNENSDKENQQGWAGLRDVRAEDRQAKIAELQKAAAERAEAYRRQIEVALKPEQVEQLKQIGFQMRAATMLSFPQVAERLGVTEEQKQKIAQNREQFQEKQWRLQLEMNAKALEVLTPEQRKKLEELMSTPPQPTGPAR